MKNELEIDEENTYFKPIRFNGKLCIGCNYTKTSPDESSSLNRKGKVIERRKFE